jgi:phosphatidylserine decarboxylase
MGTWLREIDDETMTKDCRAIRSEQFRQAKSLSGGLVRLSLAALGVRLARIPIPSKRLRLWIYRGFFGKRFPPGLDETEAEKPLWAYPSLNEVFTRGVKPECRPIPAGTPQFLYPCDGTVQDAGPVEGGKILTLKGIEYTLASLLPRTDPRPFEGGRFVVVFLSPIHCHRVFSPQDGYLEEAIHVPGYRLPVHPPYQRAEYPVYTLNERMILRFSTPLGPCLVVMVAGWGVGNITLPLAPGFCPRSRGVTSHSWSPAAPVRRGEWVATFELGSTVVLLTPPAAHVTSLVSPNEEVKYGQPALTYPG